MEIHQYLNEKSDFSKMLALKKDINLKRSSPSTVRVRS